MQTIVRYPHPALFQICEPVTVFDDELKSFAEELLASMRAAPGVGITAAHVGRAIRLAVIELPQWKGPRFYVNPEVIESSQATILHGEGSVSMPGATEEIERPNVVKVRYQTLDGATMEEEATGFYAVCLQHEIDQLDGIFWIKRLSRLKRDRLVKRWEKEQAGRTAR